MLGPFLSDNDIKFWPGAALAPFGMKSYALLGLHLKGGLAKRVVRDEKLQKDVLGKM